MEKRHIDRRLAQMEAEGTRVPGRRERRDRHHRRAVCTEFDAVVLVAAPPRARPAHPGPPVRGHLPGDGIPALGQPGTAGRSGARRRRPAADHRQGKRVIIIGGGDTGADCLGTAHRQGAASVHQFEIMPRPPESRADSTPWPTYPLMFRVSSAHEEGGERVFSVNTEKFLGHEGKVTGLRAHEVVMSGGKFEKVEAPTSNSTPTWCCWRWASSAPSGRVC